jgi:hypothetical protein
MGGIMGREWITGKEIMDVHGIAAAELGKSCFDGTLTAYVPEVLKKIYDFSKVQRVPKYPPPGIDPLQYVQTGEKVKWDWEFILGVKPLKILLLKIEKALGECFAVYRWKANKVNSLWGNEYDTRPPLGLLHIPRYAEDEEPRKVGGIYFAPQKYENQFSEFDIDTLLQKKNELEHMRWDLNQKILKLTEPNFEALIESQILAEKSGMSDDELYSFARKNAFYTVMSVQCSYLIDGEIIDELSIKDRLIYFDFDMYHRYLDSLTKLLHGDGYVIPLEHVVVNYKAQLAVPWFKRSEVPADWLGEAVIVPAVPSEPTAPAPDPAKAEPAQAGEDGVQGEVRIADEKTPLNIPPSLWAGKTASAIMENLRAASFDDNVIAFVMDKAGVSKQEAGRMLFPAKPGEEKETSTYQRKIDGCIKRVIERYDLIFSG